MTPSQNNPVDGEKWPCPNNCMSWCRSDLRWENGKLMPMTNHHPRCEHVDASLIDVWKVSDGSTSYYDEDEVAANNEGENCDDITITKIKMHREIYDNLPEFDGF